ncbi:MAG: large subunit ribosomal protein [Chthoniobacter sp.]|jgi:large subunit ribosomal protein L17|nr:large subunit ribosomal protein [Chthoniobacter sp.]
MRHQRKTVKLGRKEGHRKSLLANLACSLIEHQRIKTTLAKAKAVRPLAEKLVTIGKKNTLHARRTAKAVLRQDGVVKMLFEDVAPRAAARKGGYTRIIKLGQRQSDAAPMALIEWVDGPVIVETAAPEPKGKKAAKAKAETAPAKAEPGKSKAEAAPVRAEPAKSKAEEAPAAEAAPAEKAAPAEEAKKKPRAKKTADEKPSE